MKISILHHIWPWFIYFAFFSTTHALYGQVSPQTFPDIRITVSKGQLIKLKTTKGYKIKLNNAVLTINGDTAKVKDLHLRGKTTLNFKRKSFSVDLAKSLHMTIGSQIMSLKKFHLLNLSMDKNLWHNRWAYLTMSQFGIFPPFNTYCTLLINNESQGIYLLVEKPHHAVASMKSPYMVRRGVNHAIDHEYIDTDSREEVKKYRKQYHSLYATGKLKGEALYQHISNALHTDLYFRWIAFNYFIRNGDYSDELFLYINPDDKLYDIMAWDYDDLFMPNPHEGYDVRNQHYKDRMIYSLEDSFDKTIAADDFVYSKYQISLKQLLLGMDSTLLTTFANKVLNELTLLSKNPENCQATRYLDKYQFNIDDARDDIEKSIAYLINYRTQLLKKLDQVPLPP